MTHLWNEHKIRLVTPASPNTMANGTAVGQRTRCPVCRKHVSDLSQHFAMEHCEKINNNNGGAAAASSRSLVTLAATATQASRIIPIVLPNQPGKKIPKLFQDSFLISISSLVPALNLPGSKDSRHDIVVPKGRQTGGGGSGNSVSIIALSSSGSPTAESDSPVNLSVRGPNASTPNGHLNMNGAAEVTVIPASGGESAASRKRRKQTHVPNDNKDEKYWARRMKNNEAAKRSRDMRIRREKVIFEENLRLESLVRELRGENDRLGTENKELHLKLDFILDENARLKGLVQAQDK